MIHLQKPKPPWLQNANGGSGKTGRSVASWRKPTKQPRQQLYSSNSSNWFKGIVQLHARRVAKPKLWPIFNLGKRMRSNMPSYCGKSATTCSSSFALIRGKCMYGRIPLSGVGYTPRSKTGRNRPKEELGLATREMAHALDTACMVLSVLENTAISSIQIVHILAVSQHGGHLATTADGDSVQCVV